MANPKVWAIYKPGADGKPGMGGKVYLTVDQGGLLQGGAQGDVAGVLASLGAGKMPKWSKPYPATVGWAIASGFSGMVPLIVKACESVAQKIGNADGYADALALVKAGLVAPVPKAADAPIQALVSVVASPALVPDGIDNDSVPVGVTVILGRWLEIDGPLFQDGIVTGAPQGGIVTPSLPAPESYAARQKRLAREAQAQHDAAMVAYAQRFGVPAIDLD